MDRAYSTAQHELFLSAGQLTELTGKVRRGARVNVLRQMGVNFKLRPDGFPLVLKSHIEKEFDGSAESTKKRREPDWNALNAESAKS